VKEANVVASAQEALAARSDTSFPSSDDGQRLLLHVEFNGTATAGQDVAMIPSHKRPETPRRTITFRAALSYHQLAYRTIT
jgi:hypothetical protein